MVPVDAEPTREVDGFPICFDWLVWKTISEAMVTRPPNVPGPFAFAIQHHKTETQIPDAYLDIWDKLRSSQHIDIESAVRWNMNAKRMETQAKRGDILITIGGGEGVRYLANIYHEAGKPVVPLNFPIVAQNTGSRELHQFGLASDNSRHLFEIAEGGNSHSWMNRIDFPPRQKVADRVNVVIDLLESLERPTAFAIRLLNGEHDEFAAVQDFFDIVVKPFVEDELGYRLRVIDGSQAYDHARIDDEIFAKLHRSSLVIADLTGTRPNCFIELGYALGRCIPTLVTARSGFQPPFDITTIAELHWKTDGTVAERRRALREYWLAVRNRPPLVKSEGLLP